MNFSQYKNQIDTWSKLANAKKITLSNNKELPITYWKSFLGLTRKQHQDMYRGTFKNKTGLVPKYVEQAIRFAILLPEDIFIEQVKIHIPIFEADKIS
ncbi:hypothetical protein [Pseudoalteromonas marina]|uniref:Uncharacterized protein n=1 Tax=Pseudoalteromonas marina TaxID=267375 RepID=A0ABT9FI28_9GAMM|nr:hypothetical protein [Pseudoalteromonas marina]MDP2566430.1 hypothetical protein [Pseudoalteromonas marina]